MFSSTVYTVIVDTFLSRTWSRSKKAPCVKTHLSHLSLPDEVVNAEEDSYYGNNIKWKWKDKSKGKADSNWDSYPHQLNLKKSFQMRIQRLSLVAHPKNVFAPLPLKAILLITIGWSCLNLIAADSSRAHRCNRLLLLNDVLMLSWPAGANGNYPFFVALNDWFVLRLYPMCAMLKCLLPSLND